MKEKTMRILSIGIAHRQAQQASDKNDYDKLREIWEAVSSEPNILGDANDYHNYAVVMSKEDDYLTAYEIVARGLQQFPYNTDLLADAIYYGSNCKKYEECNHHVETLLGRPKSSWTWRAFTFLIDFFKNRCDWVDDSKVVEEGLHVALEVAKSYQKYLPTEERSYVAEYELRKSLSKVAMDNSDFDKAKEEKEAGLQLLRNTINNGKYSAVQCCLRYADAIFEEQKYEEVIEVCNRAMQYGEDTASARLGYFMYLSAQSHEILLYRSGDWRMEEKVQQVYAEYLAALADTGDSYRNNIKRRVKILAARSGIPAPDELVGNVFGGLSKDELLGQLFSKLGDTE